jgi:hypothetical protein
MIVSEIHLYEMLKAKIGDREAEAFVEILEKRVERKFDESKQYLATKQDLSDTKSEILRWTFSFVFGAVVINIVAIIGAIVAIANLMKK